MFKFEGKQKLWITSNGHPVTVIARTEFFTGKKPRYCVQSVEDAAIPGKNAREDWINEEMLTDIEPVKSETKEAAPVEGEKSESITTSGKKGIRSKGKL